LHWSMVYMEINVDHGVGWSIALVGWNMAWDGIF
jgi:hypothetical protein